MGILDRFRGKQESNEQIVTSVMNQTDLQPSYPDANYASFAQHGYAGNELVFACIREIATSSAEAMLCLYDQEGEIIQPENKTIPRTQGSLAYASSCIVNKPLHRK